MKSAWPANPVLHEIYTWVWLTELSERCGRPVTLADVPTEVWDDVARSGIDAVWLMGVWQRSPHGAQIARTNAAMRGAAEAALPGLTDADIVGSAYCIRSYMVDEHLGGDTGLAVARGELARRGVRLVLDLVPNHVAPDHEWTRTHPEFFVQGTTDELHADPASYIEVDGRVLACGRDPYFPAWPEVVQFDASSTSLRGAMVELVLGLAEVCDGVRCDMAMLMLDDVATRTWGDRLSGGPAPDGGRGYWPTIIEPVKAAHPDFVFWAEAYWDLEPVLLEQGFDACYDKRLYDRLVHRAPVHEVRAHLAADLGYQSRTVRFAENHDEPRAASVMNPALHRAALTAVLTLPGVALLHEGEETGRQVRVPVILGRRPAEEPDHELHAFVDRLLAALGDGLRRGRWEMVAVEGWPDNRSCDQLLAWAWTTPDRRFLVVVNLGDGRADGRVRLPWTDLAETLEFSDRLSGEVYERAGGDIAGDGLYVALDASGIHLFEVT